MIPARAFRPAGRLTFERGDGESLDEARIALLEQIRATGSITKAGKAVGISYRTAWLAVDHLNGLAEAPLVERLQGGSGGGGTRLTPEGEELVRMYRAAAAEHARYLERLRAGLGDLDRFLRLSRKLALRSSARNQLFGTVESVRARGLEAEVVLRLKGKDRIAARITRAGLEGLGLAEGEEAYALIKANWISLGKPARAAKGANALACKVHAVAAEGGKAEVQVALPGGTLLVAMVDGPAEVWKPGAPIAARFRAEDVILGVAR